MQACAPEQARTRLALTAFTCATVVSRSYWHLQKMQAVKESIQGSQKRARRAASEPLPKRHKAVKPAVADKLGKASDDIDIEDIALFTAQEAIQAKLCTSLLLAASLSKQFCTSCLGHNHLSSLLVQGFWYKDPEGLTHCLLFLPDSAGAACLV